MRSLLIGAAALSLLSAPVLAETVARTGAMVRTSDGKKVGRIYQIDGGQTAVILTSAKAIKIDVATLSGEGKNLVTSLTAAEVARLK